MKTTGYHLPSDTLSPAECKRLCDAPSPRCPTGIRNRALLAVLYRSGLRIGEALELTLDSVDFDRAIIAVRASKSREGIRFAATDKIALERVQLWLEARARHFDQAISQVSTRRFRSGDFAESIPIGSTERFQLGDSYLFTTLEGAPLSYSYCAQAIRRCARRAGLTQRVHAHALRHAHAVELLREGAHLALIRDQLGHSNISVTDRYLQSSAFREQRLALVHSRGW